MRALRSRVKPIYFWLRRVVNESVIERRLGIETARVVRTGDLGLEQEGRNGCEPSSWLTLRLALPRAAVDHDDVFLDLGSGMGRIVYQAASQYRLRRVIGVELSNELHEIAVANINEARPRLRCPAVELVCSDALAYDIPDEVTVVFLSNPFRGATFAAVIDKLLESHDRRPRHLRVLYRTPEEHDHLMATGRFRLTRTIPGLRPGKEWSRTSSTRVYDVVPAVTERAA